MKAAVAVVVVAATMVQPFLMRRLLGGNFNRPFMKMLEPRPLDWSRSRGISMSVEAVFTVNFEGRPYEVEVCYNPGKSVAGVKELIVTKLKSNYDEFDAVKAGYLTLKTLDEKVIVGTRMPKGDDFLAELKIPEPVPVSKSAAGTKKSSTAGTRKSRTRKSFEASEEQLKECFHVLEEDAGLKEIVKSFDEEKFFKECPFLHAHRLGKALPSKAADALRGARRSVYQTAVLLGVSGCGKSHAIYLNALEKTCIYLTPNSWILRDFYDECTSVRPSFDFTEEISYRKRIKGLFFKYVCARHVVLLYLKQECSVSEEFLFFMQSANGLDPYDSLILELISKNYSKITKNLLSGCFLAIDEAQLYFYPEYDILFRTGVKKKQRISFARFFSWCAPVLGAPVVISGTALSLRDMDRLGSGNRPLPEYGLKILYKFDYFNRNEVKDIVMKLLGSDIDEDVLKRMSFFLQGRPRILMNFIENCKRKQQNPAEYLEEYIRLVVENGESTVWSLYGIWKDLFEGSERKQKVKLTLKNSKSDLDCDVQTCFLKILMDAIRFVGDEDADGISAESGSWFYLTSDKFDIISAGLCPLVELEEFKYSFLEPLSLFSGIHYVVSSPLRSRCLEHLLEAMLDKGATEQNRGSSFDLFVAIKVAVDASFRRRLFEMAVEIGIRDDRTKWISNVKLPEKDYFKLKCKISDEAFVESLESDDEDVVLPSSLAGPDVKWWLFLFGLKTTWTKSLVGADESRKNEETITPSLCFDWRDEGKKGEPLPKKRKALNDKCVEIAQSRVKESRGFIRVRIELPSSDFVSKTDRESTKDIHLDIGWKVFRTLLSEDEAGRFEVYCKYFQ